MLNVQALAAVVTIVAAVVSGFVTGKVVLRNPASFADVPDYQDTVWWVVELYIEC
jgi:hypothetical protein